MHNFKIIYLFIVVVFLPILLYSFLSRTNKTVVKESVNIDVVTLKKDSIKFKYGYHGYVTYEGDYYSVVISQSDVKEKYISIYKKLFKEQQTYDTRVFGGHQYDNCEKITGFDEVWSYITSLDR